MPDSGDLQFERAEYSGGLSGPVCCTCKQPATPAHYQFRGRVYCGNCRAQIEQSVANLHESAGMQQALLFGVGAAALSAAVLYLVDALAHVGIVAAAVGYFVGKAVRKGSRSAGGLSYQLLAAVLTYFSIASSYTLGIAREMIGQGHIFSFVYLTMAAPFLGGVRDLLGLLIMGIAIWQAWKLNQRVEVRFEGPFTSVAPTV